MSFTPSPYQQAVFDHLERFPEADNLMVEAVAGSGKTTTIVHGLRHLPAHLNVCMLAFNKSIATELSGKVPAGVVVKTFHSLGFAAYRSAVPGRVEVDGKKTYKVLETFLNRDECWDYGAPVAKLVGLAKQAGFGLPGVDTSAQQWQALADHYDVSAKKGTSWTRVLAHAARALELSGRTLDVVDFDDMLYMPLLTGAAWPHFDVVFVDEAQDTNRLQVDIVKALIEPKPGVFASGPPGRLVFVGDRRQAIYGFRGADASALDNISAEFRCRHLPLSVTYRCPKTVVREAQTNGAPEIEAYEHAAEGAVKVVETFHAEDFGAADAVLCRNKAPLLSLAYACIAQGVGVRFLGREIGQGLIKLVEKLRARDLDDLLAKLRTWERKETDRARADGREMAVAAAEDKAECIRVAVGALPLDATVGGLVASLKAVFDEKRGRLLTLSTIHKSKGMEWPVVWLLDEHLMPSKWALQAWQQEQEANLRYVAITRAESELRYIYSDGWRE